MPDSTYFNTASWLICPDFGVDKLLFLYKKIGDIYMKRLTTKSIWALSAFLILAFATSKLYAHHSFAIYDIDNKISRTGTLTDIRFVTPHILMELEAVLEDGSVESWKIESMNPSRFDSLGSQRDFVHPGDAVTILGWPLRNGRDEMALSTIVRESDGEVMVVVDEIRQGRARDNLPETTIRRE